MNVLRWIIRILAAAGAGVVWWFTAAELSAASDAVAVSQGVAKGITGLLSITLIAWLLTRKDG